MKAKALVLGALPGSFEGPEVPLDDGAEWVIECPNEAKGFIFVRRVDGLPPAQYSLENGLRIRKVRSARVVLEETEVMVSVSAICVG